MAVGQETDQIIWENQQKIPSHEIQLGHFVAQLSSPWHQTPFVIQGFVIADESELQWIKKHCDWVVIDLKKSRDATALTHAFHQSGNKKPSLLVSKPISEKSMKASLTLYLNLAEQTRQLVDHFEKLDQGDIRKSIVTVRNITLALNENLPALIWLTRIKHEDAYTAEHCLNVCVLAMGLAQSLNWTDKDVAQVGVAGLLHDLGKIDIDHAVLNKPGKLTAEEYEQMKRHPKMGYDRLLNEPDLNELILHGIRDHHERPDGQGYPAGKTASDIGDMAKVVAVVDAYDAITSNRVYQKARSHHEAMSILWRTRGSQFDAKIVEAFIHFLGWVTPGTLVELSSGDLAVVLQANEGQRLYPKVRILMPTNRGYTLGATWNLSAMNTEDSTSRIHIGNVVPDGYLGIHLEEFANRLFQ